MTDQIDLEARLKNAEDELQKKCAEIVVLQQALQSLVQRVIQILGSIGHPHPRL